MRPLHEIQQDRAHFIRSAEDLTNKAEKEDRMLTDEEAGLVSEHMANAKKLEAEIDARKLNDQRIEQARAAAKKLREDSEKPGKPIVSPSQPSADPSEPQMMVPATAKRWGGNAGVQRPERGIQRVPFWPVDSRGGLGRSACPSLVLQQRR